ncbi:MAG TPA: threonine synthase [Bryobacteraceae bacterium]|jgi:threonine synthase
MTHLECSRCARRYEAGKPLGLCECGGPLLARYDLEKLRTDWSRDSICKGPASMWRYAPALPVSDAASIVSLGEGMTPLVRAQSLGASFGASGVWVKDDGVNPTGTFKARGMSCAISMCCELGVKKVAVPSAGNAAGAAAAYAAAAGLEAHIFMPRDVPRANLIECCAAGARVTLVDGLISDCARMVAEKKEAEGWFDLSTLKEPYRIEGKKTMGYELAEQFDWRLPDAILYPCGGGVGIIGMWKAFAEMEALGWISSKRPKMIAVQAEGCPPIVRAFEEGKASSEFYPNAETLASGLRVPKALGDFLALNAVRSSGGTAIAVSDDEILEGVAELAAKEGIFAAPEGGACVAACRRLFADGFLDPGDRVVIYNTGSGLKYLDVVSPRFTPT